ncbi:uncharacterized protein EI90DRAFT_3117357 [Cantharellus anzutake]|uniref:uncharacterized protein n=1 Tax=Cantharellus anzutake TaxID=1750568 RepID=UPI001906A432|nr:uncharacterized protein EI90DRAFT_3117357 [Cantharellus anzutake]KAF8339536.1 hypothetical protein EI90DRAFT_3117357 [Cantharellus anzutake]
MHDLLDKKYVHADIAADPYAFSKTVLSPIGGVYAEIDLIRDGRALTISKIIDSVSWTTEKRLRADSKWGEWHDSCLELHCVQDADRLDAIGAFGIMRCAAFSSVMNRPLFVPPEDESDREAESAIAHFHDKLLQIKDRLKTEAGKRMGEERHDFMLDFLNAVDKEYYAPVT